MAEGPNNDYDNCNKQKEHTSSQEEGRFDSKTMKRYLPLAVGVTAVGVTLTAIPVVVAAAGFGAGGIAAGSLGASMMSAAATKGVGMAVVSTLQSVGAAGMALGTKIGVGATVGPLSGTLAQNYLKSKLSNYSHKKDESSEGQTSGGEGKETPNYGNTSTARVGMALSAAFHSVGTAGLAMGAKVASGATNTGISALNYLKGKKESTDGEKFVGHTPGGEWQKKSNSESTTADRHNDTCVKAQM